MTLENYLRIRSKHISQCLNNSSNIINTPNELVEQMLNSLPYEIWESTTKTFCDLSCGTGVFLLNIFVRYYVSLENKFPNKIDRIKNILSRLYGYDNNIIQTKLATKQFRRLFDFLNLKIEDFDLIQVYCEDSLKYNFNMKFDVLLGNPPFQPDVSTTGGSGSRCMIWHKFVERAFTLVKDDGHMLFITPSNWRTGGMGKGGPYRNVREKMWKSNLTWLLDTRSPIDYFKSVAPITIDAWQIDFSKQKSSIFNSLPTSLFQRKLLPKQNNTITICEKFFAKSNNSECFELLMKRDNGKSDILNSKNGSNDCQYKLAVTSSKVKNNIYNWRIKKPESYSYKKVIVSDTGNISPWYDNGNCGVDAGGYCIVRSQFEGEKVTEFLNSPLTEFIARQFSNKGQLRFPIYLFNKIPKDILYKSWQEVFDFTQEEIKLICGN